VRDSPDEGDAILALALKLERTIAGAALNLHGTPCTPDLSGGLWFEASRTLVVSDLHLEKGSAFAERRGSLLPPYDTRETLAQLHEVVARLDPATVVALGDSFHDAKGPGRMDEGDRAMVAALQSGRDWVWITGNHDRAVPTDGRADGLGGRFADEVVLGTLTLRHEPTPGAVGEVAGHLHPCGKVAMRGRAVRRRCFVTDGSRMVMPAFGAYAGGLNVRDTAFEPLFPKGFTAHLIGDGRVFAIGKAMLARD
jgi:uncharacterized protein